MPYIRYDKEGQKHQNLRILSTVVTLHVSGEILRHLNRDV